MAKTFRKAYYRELAKYLHITKAMSMDDAKALAATVQKELPGPVTLGNAGEYGEAVAAYLPRHQRENGFEEITQEEAQKAAGYAAETAWRETDKPPTRPWKLGAQPEHHELPGGRQVPFSSLNYGTDTSEQGRMVIRNLLLATEAGLGDGETPIFPVQIFKVKEGVNYNEGDPNYDLFKLAMRVSVQAAVPQLQLFGRPLQPAVLQARRLRHRGGYMGCRTRVMGNVHDKNREVTCGRGNLSFTSINLPRIGIEAQKDIKKVLRNPG